MKTLLVCVLLLILSASGFLLYKEYFVERKLRKLASKKYDIVEPLMKKLESKEDVTAIELLTLVIDPSIRQSVFRLLTEYKRIGIFPSEYLTFEKGAEAVLVSWLEYPTELGIAPSEIELVTKITLLDGESFDYYVFKYRTAPPHWAVNWRLGVSGPYTNTNNPYDVPSRVYSRFAEVGTSSPENEVQWVHTHVN